MILPTARAALLAALAAPVALVIAATAPGAWVVAPAAGVLLLALVLVDAGIAGRLTEWRVLAPDDAEIGEAFALRILADIARGTPGTVEAAVACDPRLDPAGRLLVTLARADGAWQGEAALVPVRRGTAPLTHLWLR